MEEKYMKNKINNKRKTKILTFSSFQNSSAKTTLVQNIGFELANQGYKILIVDADFSCRLSNFFDCDLTSEKNIFNAYKNSEWNEPVDIKKYISNTKYENLDIVHSTYEMININREFQGKSHKEDTFIIPLVTNPIEIMGLETILKDIGGIKKTNTKLKLLGFLKSKVSDNNSSGEAVKKMDKISEEYNVPFFESHIPYDENIFKSQLERMPLEVYANKYDINSNTVKEFKNLAEEIINKEKL
jgi:cellulose biosynthesis protein BcsQ